MSDPKVPTDTTIPPTQGLKPAGGMGPHKLTPAGGMGPHVADQTDGTTDAPPPPPAGGGTGGGATPDGGMGPH
jgi:hypothetical protein